MRELFSKDVLLSLLKAVSLKDQTDRTKRAIKELPTVLRYILGTFASVPSLVLIYLIITGIDVQYRVSGPISEGTALFSALVTLALLTAANALCYVETYNKYTDADPIQKPGRYVARRALRLAGVIFTTSMIILFGFFMFIIPGLYFSLRLSLAAPACIIEDLSIRESLRRSLDVTKGQVTFVHTVFSSFGILIIPTVILLVTTSGLTQIVLVFVLYGVYPPVIHTALTLLYLNATEDNTINLYFTNGPPDSEPQNEPSKKSTTSAAVTHSSTSDAE